MTRRAKGAADRAARGAAAEPTLEDAWAPDGVDLTLIHWMLERSPLERLQAAQSLIDAAWKRREA